MVSPQVKEGSLHNPLVGAVDPNGFVSRNAVRLATVDRPPARKPDLGFTPLVVAAKVTFPKLGVGCSAPFYGPLCDIPHLAGRTAVVTGANSGLGFETALALARAGARVVLACRDQAKGGAALDRIRQAVPDADVRLDPLDLADLASVRKFAAGFSAEHDGLNILVNNAGVMAIPAGRPPTASRCSSAPTTSATSLSPACCSTACSPGPAPGSSRSAARRR